MAYGNYYSRQWQEPWYHDPFAWIDEMRRRRDEEKRNKIHQRAQEAQAKILEQQVESGIRGFGNMAGLGMSGFEGHGGAEDVVVPMEPGQVGPPGPPGIAQPDSAEARLANTAAMAERMGVRPEEVSTALQMMGSMAGGGPPGMAGGVGGPPMGTSTYAQAEAMNKRREAAEGELKMMTERRKVLEREAEEASPEKATGLKQALGNLDEEIIRKQAEIQALNTAMRGITSSQGGVVIGGKTYAMGAIPEKHRGSLSGGFGEPADQPVSAEETMKRIGAGLGGPGDAPPGGPGTGDGWGSEGVGSEDQQIQQLESMAEQAGKERGVVRYLLEQGYTLEQIEEMLQTELRNQPGEYSRGPFSKVEEFLRGLNWQHGGRGGE